MTTPTDPARQEVQEILLKLDKEICPHDAEWSKAVCQKCLIEAFASALSARDQKIKQAANRIGELLNDRKIMGETILELRKERADLVGAMEEIEKDLTPCERCHQVHVLHEVGWKGKDYASWEADDGHSYKAEAPSETAKKALSTPASVSALERRRAEREALEGLVLAVEKDSKENNSISGFTAARLSDAKAALARLEGKEGT